MNYPPGAEHDPRAPWNQRDYPDFKKIRLHICAQCGHGDDEPIEINDEDICEECFEKNQEDSDE